MNRRVLMLGGAGAAAAVVGAGLWQWRSRPDPAAAALWALRFERPDGAPLVMAAFRGRPLLLNFWATWCPPCVKELPMIDQFQRDQRGPAGKGWQVVGLAVDQRAPVLAFLQRQPVSFDVGLAGLQGIDLARTLGNTGGGLPFTIALDRHGGIIQRKLGSLQAEDLARWAQA